MDVALSPNHSVPSHKAIIIKQTNRNGNHPNSAKYTGVDVCDVTSPWNNRRKFADNIMNRHFISI